MWISSCRLKYEQYKYTSYITSRVIMVTFIMQVEYYCNGACCPTVHTLHYCNGTRGPAVQTMHYCNGTHGPAVHTLHYCNGTRVVQMSTHCITAMQICGPAVHTLQYCNGTRVVQLSTHFITAMAYVRSSCPHTALLHWHVLSSCPHIALLQWYMCGPDVHTLHY
jgi:hypothetical protein